ncbi:uncharacterized protein B0I36DRAFT_358625 [Microdochium trichocladiopsis]|uniref:Uncharacterized protein n=1 Tax=Microdochium trichocladiopsis TaxID=1682393 RepID=A0A9P9BWI7_9PEZI|nr:uncharacterized protein B0I36DRAFT_358625 [Microdochium trichocladiopsis]KAH7041458.1 hypothetical protein B0I36DRAFT_358625 [Microdochium trichocladiopsis]
MYPYQCTQTDIRALFLESPDDPGFLFDTCPESCEFLFGTESPRLFEIHQGAFIQAILTVLFSAPYLLAFYLSSVSGRRKLRRLFNGFFALQLLLSVPVLLISMAMFFDVKPRSGDDEQQVAAEAAGTALVLHNGGVLPSIPDMLVADALVQLEIFGAAVLWCTLWLRSLLDGNADENPDAGQKGSSGMSGSSDDEIGNSGSNGNSSSNKRMVRPFRLSPLRSNNRQRRQRGHDDQHRGYLLVPIALTISLMVTIVFGPWYLVQRLYSIAAPNVALARELCGPQHAPLAVDPSKIDAVPRGVHVLLLALLLLAVAAVRVFDRNRSRSRRRKLVFAGLVVACAYAHGFVLGSVAALAGIRAALVALLGDGAGVGNVTSAARVLAVVVWVPVVVSLMRWFWRAVLLASGLCPSFVTKCLPPPRHPPSPLWRFNPRPKSLADRFRLRDPDDDDNIFGGHLAAYDPNPSQEHMHCGPTSHGRSASRASQLPRSPPKVAGRISERGRSIAGDAMGRGGAGPAPQQVQTVGVSARGLPMQVPTTWV